MLTNIFQIDAAESDRYKMPFLRIIKIHILHLQWFFLVNDLARTGTPQYIFNTYNSHWQIQGGRPPGGSKFFHFHALFGKKFAK